jgi:REP element-mobilizing transposase RayT
MRAIKNVRLPHYDYRTNGHYFVTVVADGRKDLFTGKVGEIITQVIEQIGTWPGLRMDYHVVMANHVHMILELRDSPLSLGEAIRRFKAICSRAAENFLWQPNYYEHVIRNDKALTRIREYIQNNPEAEKLDAKAFYL